MIRDVSTVELLGRNFSQTRLLTPNCGSVPAFLGDFEGLDQKLRFAISATVLKIVLVSRHWKRS